MKIQSQRQAFNFLIQGKTDKNAKGTVSVISSKPSSKDGNVVFFSVTAAQYNLNLSYFNVIMY